MEDIAYLRNCCRANGINPDEFLKLGRGSKGPSSDNRYKFSPTISTIKETQLYAIQYFEDVGVYIAWDATRKKHPFSLKASEIILPMGERVCSVKKANQYSGWGEELVLYFQREGIPDFLERYIFNNETNTD